MAVTDITLSVKRDPTNPANDIVTWDTLPAGVYRLRVDGKWISNSFDGSKTSWRVDRGSEYVLRAFGPVIAEGIWPPVTPPPPPPPPPSLEYVFDGRATRQVYLPATGSVPPPPIPGTDELWNCIYLNSDITLINDQRWGKAYAVRLNANSKNPWGVPPLGSWQGPGSMSAELTHVRTVDPNQIDWYAISYRPHDDWNRNYFNIIAQLGYPTLSSPPIALNVTKDIIGLDLDGGVLTELGHPGWWGGTHNQRLRWPTANCAGSWVDIVIGVQWALDNTGKVYLASRCLDKGEDWIVRYNKSDIPTYQQHPQISASIPWKRQCMDKQGGYIGYDPAPPPGWIAHIDLRGMTRHTTWQEAEASLA